MEYLFNYWCTLKKDLSDKNIMLFLDFDGTLTPIADSPEKAVMPKETRAVLDALSRNPLCKIAIISGRSLTDIKDKVGLKDIIYAGNHGLEIEGPQIKFTCSISSRQKKILEKLKNDLTKNLAPIKGAFLEDKRLSLSVHFRLVDEEQVFEVKKIFDQTLFLSLGKNKIKDKIKDEIKINSGKKVLEIKPQIEWDKGRAVLWLLAQQHSNSVWKNNIVPIYIGDDLTDEDAFKVLSNKGLTIFVGNSFIGSNSISFAKYYLKDTDEVREFLNECNKMLIKGEIK